MKLFLAIALAALQAEPPPVQPWTGTLAEGLAGMRKLSEEGKPDEALAIGERILAPGGFAKWREEATARPGWKRTLVLGAEPLLAAVGLSDRSSAERGAVHFARGVVLARAEKRGESALAFEKARALAGPGELRLDATYDLAWAVLEEGEILRKQIPEVGGTPPQPPAPAMPATPGAPAMPGVPEAPDPLQLARAAYTLARDRFVESLRADPLDLDSRANVELAQKRLKELDEIERKREEEKQKQEQEKQEQQKKDEEQKNQDQKNDESKDPNQDDESDEQKKKDEEPKPPEEQPKPDEKDQEKKEAKPETSKEQLLTKEEIMRLLDTLKDREEEGKKLMERLRRANRARVKKDW